MKKAEGKLRTIYIKNMVSNRDVRVVKDVLEKTGAIAVDKAELGRADIIYDEKKITIKAVGDALKLEGFDLLQDKEDQLVEQIKIAVLELFYYGNNANTIIRNSDYLSDKLGIPYVQISKVFSERTHHTLEKYIILVKIERVKELLSYEELTLSEISYMMGYSSVQYLSNQFKQITTYSVTDYKQKKISDRIPLDMLLEKY